MEAPNLDNYKESNLRPLKHILYNAWSFIRVEGSGQLHILIWVHYAIILRDVNHSDAHWHNTVPPCAVHVHVYADHIVHITSLQARIMVVSLVKLAMNYSSQFKVDQTPYLVKGLRAHWDVYKDMPR